MYHNIRAEEFEAENFTKVLFWWYVMKSNIQAAFATTSNDGVPPVQESLREEILRRKP